MICYSRAVLLGLIDKFMMKIYDYFWEDSMMKGLKSMSEEC